MVCYGGRVVCVSALSAALTRAEAARARLESAVSEARGVARSQRSAALAALASQRRAAQTAHAAQAALAVALERNRALTVCWPPLYMTRNIYRISSVTIIIK